MKMSTLCSAYHVNSLVQGRLNSIADTLELHLSCTNPLTRCNAIIYLYPGTSFVMHFLTNSLAPGKFEWNFRYVIFKWILVIDGWGISCEIALIRMSLDFSDDQSTLVQVMVWCRQATRHHPSQCWPRSLPPCGVTRPQWVNSTCI